MTSTPHRVAIVFAHPFHEILVGGLLHRWHPDILFLTRGDGSGLLQREDSARRILSEAGHEGRLDFLGLEEPEIYRRMLEGETDWFLDVRERVAAWLEATMAETLVYDAFEWYHPIHDLTPLLATRASRQCHLDIRHQFEIPISLMLSTPPEFPADSLERFSLSEEESRGKRQLAQGWANEETEFRRAVDQFPDSAFESDLLRPVSPDRDFAAPPKWVFGKNYDEKGRDRVARGRYRTAIEFTKHFRPIAECLAD